MVIVHRLFCTVRRRRPRFISGWCGNHDDRNDALFVWSRLFYDGSRRSGREIYDQKKSLTVLVSLGFAIGIVITIAEPSVQVLGQQVYDISDGEIGRVLLIGIVSVGTGVFLAFALLRVVFKLSYYQLMAIGYIGVLIASFSPVPNLCRLLLIRGVTTGQ